MNAQQLRNSILQEAIEGRLVPQDPNDEPASALLERIREEKRRLVKEGKLKKKDLVETPISEDEKPFEIPESWEWVRLGNVSEIARGGSPRPIKEYLTESPDGLNWIKIGDTDKGGKYINSCKEKIKPEGLKKTRMVHPGDFLLTNSMSFGRPYITNIEGCIHDGWLMISPYAGAFDQSYLYYVLSSAFAHKQFNSKVAGAVVQNLNSDKVAESLIPLPPLAEQKRIVAKIEELMPKVEEYGKAQEALDKLNAELPEKLKKSILQEAIEGRLVPQDPNDEPASVLLDKIRKEKAQLVKEGKLKKKDLMETPISEDEIPFEIPESWEWVRWGMLGEYKKGPFGSSLTKSMFVPKSDEAVKVYEQKNAIQKDYALGEYYISKEKYETMKGFTVHPGDIIVSCAGTIGETYLLPPDAPIGIINQALMRAKLFLDSIIPYWLLHFSYILLIENKLKGKGSAIKNIPPFEVLKAMPVPLPPLAEQHRIVERIEKLMGGIEML